MKKLLLFVFVLIAGCSSYDKELGRPLDIMYNEALYSLANGDLEEAKKNFERIVDEYPYKDEATEAQVFLIWIYYYKEDYVSAEINIESFLRYFVYNQYTPWVKYMQALVAYEQIPNYKRDMTPANNALVSFFEIAKKPNVGNSNNPYAKDAKFKIEAIKYKLAQRTMYVAEYYLENKNYIAALSTYNSIVENYPDTQYIAEALYRMTYIWLVLGVDEEAFRTTSTLGYNYPNSEWYDKAVGLISKYTKYDYNTSLKRQS
jgi:outer membrane protein assembly factor BamD